MPTSPLLNAWLADLDVLAARAHALTADLSPQQLLQRPPDGGWSIGEVFEHLAITDGSYFERLEALAARVPRPGVPDDWTPGFFARLMLKALDPANPKKLKAPRTFVPGVAVRERVVDAYVTNLARYAAIVDRADGANLNRPSIGSPALFIIRLSLGDALRVGIVHGMRHMGQVTRVRAAIGLATIPG